MRVRISMANSDLSVWSFEDSLDGKISRFHIACQIDLVASAFMTEHVIVRERVPVSKGQVLNARTPCARLGFSFLAAAVLLDSGDIA